MSLHVGFIEPHLKRYGGIRRVLELGNALVAQGHQVSYYVPGWERDSCDWMRCDGRVTSIEDGADDELDVILFNHEPQWYRLASFRRTRRTGFLALHDGSTYGKPGSWEAAHVRVDLRLANSAWTAERLSAASGQQFTVLAGGVNPEHFHPVEGVVPTVPLLCVGDDRAWKGTDDIAAAARLLGLPLARYADRDLPQSEMARAYAEAEVFVVGSHVEGFGQPGIEALACGVPLVTTDNGGCRDYAIHEETALVVPPRDPIALADAIQRVRQEPGLAERLRAGGLAMVRDNYSWEASAARLVELVTSTPEGPAPVELDRDVPADPELSVVVLQWDNLALTQGCVDSVRTATDVSYELVVVDNGSQAPAAEYARVAADVPVLHEVNRGFAGGMNAGLDAARGRVVAFCNNDTVLPDGWAAHLVAALDDPAVGMAVPALTAAGNDVTVRTEPGEGVRALPPFSAPPSGVVVVLRTADARELGGWSQHYPIASGEDVDLGFVIWTNDLDIVVDERVLVEHVGHATSDRLPDRERLWAENRRRFLDRWSDPEVDVPRLDRTDPQRFARNRATAAGAAGWMDQYFRQRDLARAGRGVAGGRSGPPLEAFTRRAWASVRDRVPDDVRQRLWPHVRGTYYRYFPERHPSALRREGGR